MISCDFMWFSFDFIWFFMWFYMLFTWLLGVWPIPATPPALADPDSDTKQPRAKNYFFKRLPRKKYDAECSVIRLSMFYNMIPTVPQMIPKWAPDDPKMYRAWCQNDTPMTFEWYLMTLKWPPDCIPEWPSNDTHMSLKLYPDDYKMIRRWA